MTHSLVFHSGHRVPEGLCTVSVYSCGRQKGESS
jgi:hypothetical protein